MKFVSCRSSQKHKKKQTEKKRFFEGLKEKSKQLFIFFCLMLLSHKTRQLVDGESIKFKMIGSIRSKFELQRKFWEVADMLQFIQF